MAWQPLNKRLSKLPLILAGPILRRTEASAVTVWLALKESRTVTLKIFSDDMKPQFEGSRKTIKFGPNLHVVAVTAEASGKNLKPGQIYLYDLQFKEGENLPAFGVYHSTGYKNELSLNYGNYLLPSFALPPLKLGDLRIIHGSCRKAHGPNLDLLPTLDDLILSSVTDPNKRPHQLFLTGDQIYADDVADSMLLMLMDAGKTLLGWDENLPQADKENKKLVDRRASELRPGKRSKTLKTFAGSTSGADKSHLLALSEYLAMYLFVWSDVLWDDEFPTFEEVLPGEQFWVGFPPDIFPSTKDPPEKAQLSSTGSVFIAEQRRLQNLLNPLSKVRRALANIPVYMIFDDHEVTDDWFISWKWTQDFLNLPLGERLLVNALTAYAVCQAWGNTPNRFETNQNGKFLLQFAENWCESKGEDPEAFNRLSEFVGVPQLDERKGEILPLPQAVTWHYSLGFPNYNVIVLDTRTRRYFPNFETDSAYFPALLSPGAMEEQIRSASLGNKDLLLLISPAPILGNRFVEEDIQAVASTKNIREKTDGEAWGLPTIANSSASQNKRFLQSEYLELLFASLARHAPENSNINPPPGTQGPIRRQRIIFLSGDVHYSLAARMQYWGERVYQDDKQLYSEFVAVQFICSSLKNEHDQSKMGSHLIGSTRLHHSGYGFFDQLRSEDEVMPKPDKVFGYTRHDGKDVLAEIHVIQKRNPLRKVRQTIDPLGLNLRKIDDRQVEIKRAPDWRYRIDYIYDPREPEARAVRVPYEPPKPFEVKLTARNREDALSTYLAFAKDYEKYAQAYGSGKEIVGLNNLGEIAFQTITNGDEERLYSVSQTLWWRLPKKNNQGEKDRLLPAHPLTQFVVSLEFDDGMYPRPEEG